MNLIPLSQTIYFNSTQLDAMSLSAIVLLSFAFHPSYSNLLYLFYGSTLNALPGKIYGSFNLLIRDSNLGSFIQNNTVMQQYNCFITCEIKVTERLFLIQSESLIGIYPVANNQQINLSPILTHPKTNLTQVGEIHRWGDINSNRFIIVLNKDNCLFGEYDNTGSGYTTSFSYYMHFNASDVLFVGLSSINAFFVVNSTNVSFLIYSCLICAYSNSIASLSTNNTFVIHTGIYTYETFRLYQGFALYNAPLANSMVYWGYANGYSWKYLINSTNFQFIEYYSNYSARSSTANHQYFILLGYYDETISFRTFSYNSTPEEYWTYSYNGQSVTPTIVDDLKISSDSAILSGHTLMNSWNIHQLELVSNCGDYNTTVNSNNSFICHCLQYYENNRCVFIAARESNSSSFPISIVIAAVAAVCVVLISAIIIKKNYKKCTKGRKRTPYIYNPVQLMSFQV